MAGGAGLAHDGGLGAAGQQHGGGVERGASVFHRIVGVAQAGAEDLLRDVSQAGGGSGLALQGEEVRRVHHVSVVELEGAQILVQRVADEHGAVAAQAEEGGLGVSEGPGDAGQLLLRDAVDVRARVGDGQTGGHEGIDEHLQIVKQCNVLDSHMIGRVVAVVCESVVLRCRCRCSRPH